MRLTKRRHNELLVSGAALSISAAATVHAQSAIVRPVDVAQWTLDGQGNALVKLHDGSIQSLTGGSFKIVRGRLVPITRDDEPALDVPGNDQPVTTGDLEELGVLELSQLITTEVDVDGAPKVMGVSTELLKQIGWYSVFGAGGIAGVVAVTSNSSNSNRDQTPGTEPIDVPDTTRPTLTITADDDTLTFNQSTTLNFDFSEDVSGFTIEDIRLSGNGTLTNFNGSGSSYTVTYTATRSNETDMVSVFAGTFVDAAGQINTLSSNKNLDVGGFSQDHGNYFSAYGAAEVITGTNRADEFTFGNNAANYRGNLTINGQGGDDEIMFGDSAGSGTGASVTVNNLSGNHFYDIGYDAGDSSGNFSITSGDGDHFYGIGERGGGRLRHLLDHCWRRRPYFRYWLRCR